MAASDHGRGWKYRHKKPIPVPSETALSPRFTRRLLDHGWRYLPRRHGLEQNRGGHWVPKGFKPIHSTLVRPNTNERSSSMPGQMYPRNKRKPPFGEGPLPGHGPGPAPFTPNRNKTRQEQIAAVGAKSFGPAERARPQAQGGVSDEAKARVLAVLGLPGKLPGRRPPHPGPAPVRPPVRGPGNKPILMRGESPYAPPLQQQGRDEGNIKPSVGQEFKDGAKRNEQRKRRKRQLATHGYSKGRNYYPPTVPQTHYA